MILFSRLLLVLIFTFHPIKGNCDDYKGGLTIEGGDYSLGQSQWKYQNGNFIAYGGEARAIYYMLFSNLPFGSFDAFDYAPNPGNKTGGFEIKIKNKTTTYNFQDNSTLLVFVAENSKLCHDYIEVPLKEWKEFMHPYANTLQDDEYLIIREHFITKTKNCR